MKSSLLSTFLILSTLSLGACGEGWEVQRTEEYAPYANGRTAGSGVVYVRAKLLPKKELNIEPPKEEVVEEQPVVEEKAPEPEVVEEVKVEEPKPVLEAEEIFKDAQTKGTAPKSAKNAVTDEHKEVKKELKAEDYIEEAPKKAEIEAEIAPAKPVTAVKANDLAEEEMAEEVVKQEFDNFSNEIVSPKTDIAEEPAATEGEETLQIIYSDPLESL